MNFGCFSRRRKSAFLSILFFFSLLFLRARLLRGWWYEEYKRKTFAYPNIHACHNAWICGNSICTISTVEGIISRHSIIRMSVMPLIYWMSHERHFAHFGEFDTDPVHLLIWFAAMGNNQQNRLSIKLVSFFPCFIICNLPAFA